MTYGIQKALNDIAGTSGFGEQAAAAAAASRVNSLLGGLREGEYYIAGNNPQVTTAAALAQGELRTVPMWLPTTTRITGVECETTVAGAAGNRTRLGIFSSDKSYPSSLLYESAALLTDGTAGWYGETNLNLLLAPGLYWFGLVSQVATSPTYRAITNLSIFPLQLSMGTSRPGSSATSGYRQTGVTGALPATFSSTVDNSSVAPRILFKTGTV